MGDSAHDDVDDGQPSAPTGTPSGGWTVVGPDGRIRSFSNRDDVLAAVAESNEVTAAPPEVEPAGRRLSLVPEEDPPPLPSKARRRSKPAEPLEPLDALDALELRPEPPLEIAPAAVAAAAPAELIELAAVSAPADSAEPISSGSVLEAQASETEAPRAVEPPPPSIAEPIQSGDLLDVTDSTKALESTEALESREALEPTHAYEETGPTSSDLQPEPSGHPPPVAPVVSMPPPFKGKPGSRALPHREDSNDGELVSLRDMVIVPAVDLESSGRSSTAPSPPKAGALRTLPPPARRTAPPPPPPTITVASQPPPAVETRPSRPVAKSTAPPPEPVVKRSWGLPFLVCAAVASVVIYMTRNPAPAPIAPVAPPTVQASGSPPTGTTATPSAEPSSNSLAPSTSASAVPSGSASVTRLAGGATEPGAARPAGGGLTEVDSQLALSEVLSRAGAARRGGDPARAKVLYERALALSAGNAEAHGGLAEIARSQGDFASAKASYERALSTSPGYGPALLGLGDVLWESGDRDGAAKRYRELLGVSSSAPERARERSGNAAAAPTAAPEN